MKDWIRRNHDHYEERYGGLDTEHLIAQAGDLSNLDRLIASHTSWFGLYREGLRGRLRGKTVIEVGFGDGLNALFMARLGAEVHAIEISEKAAAHLGFCAGRLGLPLEAVAGDFRELALPRADFIVGKALLHHLTHDVEEQFLARCAELLRPDGEARFFEPAVNMAWLDRLRWMAPVPGRPSSLRKAAFANWKANDPHPDRDNSAPTTTLSDVDTSTRFVFSRWADWSVFAVLSVSPCGLRPLAARRSIGKPTCRCGCSRALHARRRSS